MYPSPFDILEEEYDIKILDPRTAAVSEKLVIQESGKEAFFDKLEDSGHCGGKGTKR